VKCCPGTGCGGTQLAGRTSYRQVAHCWVEKRSQGGAHAPRLVVYTGRELCALCAWDEAGPTTSDAPPKVSTCDRCGADDATLFLEVVSAWIAVRARGADSITRARYSGLAVCRRCLFEAERGEQLELFQ
jgi:hypothetical protein